MNRKLIIVTAVLCTWAAVATEYATIECRGHGGETLSRGSQYSFEKKDLIVQEETGFVIKSANRLESESLNFYYRATNCADKAREYKVVRKEFLACASGRIVYANAPFCDGRKRPSWRD